MREDRQKYSVLKKYKMSTNVDNYILPGTKLFTKSGKKVTVVNLNASWLVGKIGKSIYTWFDTGNYIGSNCPHPLDIDWKKSLNAKKKKL